MGCIGCRTGLHDLPRITGAPCRHVLNHFRRVESAGVLVAKRNAATRTAFDARPALKAVCRAVHWAGAAGMGNKETRQIKYIYIH